MTETDRQIGEKKKTYRHKFSKILLDNSFVFLRNLLREDSYSLLCLLLKKTNKQ